MSKIKKLLALVLALTMVLSVSAFAGYTVAPYGDADQVDADCEVAVQLMYSLDIMKGDDKGNFRPTATITRAEMAKMIYVILNYGEDDKAANYVGAKFFTDVEAGAWYEGYVNYCASTKLIAGRGNGTFDPTAPVTTAEAAKMLLTAIGYSAEARGYVGAKWDQQVLSDASIIGLLDGYKANVNMAAPRQWVAVMVKNALTDAYTYGTIAPVVFNGLLTGTNLPATTYKTMGQKYFGLYKWDGIITANEYADLNSAKALGAGQTDIDKGEYQFKSWTTDLTEIGEYRWGYACEKSGRDIVVYVGGEDENTEFSTGKEVASITTKANIGGIKINDDTKYFVNFEEVTAKSFNSTGNGDWLRVVHNDSDSTYAEYVFLTTFEMTEVTKVAKDDTVFLANGKSSDEFVMSEDVAYGDIVLYAAFEGNEYVELAPSFTGKVEKYTYKTRTLTVGGEEYPQSDINYDSIKNEYFGDLEEAAKKTEYTYYEDFFGNVRIYTRSKSDAGELVLLTDAYYETNRNGIEAAVDAYIDGEITEVDVDFDAKYTDSENFITAGDQDKWGLLIEYWNDRSAWTNVARNTIDEEGLMSLYFATTYNYNSKGEKTTVKSDYIDLVEEDIAAGETTYDGVYGDAAVKVQATKNTVFYYVDSDLGIIEVTGYKNSYDVINEYVGINAMYAVGTRVSSEDVATDEDGDVKYWIADVIVIETVNPVFNLDNNVVLGYNVVNKTVSDFADLNVIGADAALDDLNVINYNGYNTFKANEIETPAFYFNTEDEDGESHIRKIEANFGKYGIYAETLNRVNKLDEYVVMADGDVLYYDDATVVYDMYTGRRYVAVTAEDDYEDALELTTGEDYILYVNSDDVIVYAIWVEKADDIAAELFAEIYADANPAPVVPPMTAFEAAMAKAKAAMNGSIEDMKAAVEALNDLPNADPALTVAQKVEADALAAEIQEKIDSLEKLAADAKALAEAKAEAKKALAEYVALIDANTGAFKDVTAEDMAAALAAEEAKVDALTTVDECKAFSVAALHEAGLAIQAEKVAAAELKWMQDIADARAKAIDGKTIEVSNPADVVTEVVAKLVAIEAGVYEVNMPDYNVAPGNGQVTIEGVVVECPVYDAVASATITVVIVY